MDPDKRNGALRPHLWLRHPPLAVVAITLVALIAVGWLAVARGRNVPPQQAEVHPRVAATDVAAFRALTADLVAALDAGGTMDGETLRAWVDQGRSLVAGARSRLDGQGDLDASWEGAATDIDQLSDVDPSNASELGKRVDVILRRADRLAALSAGYPLEANPAGQP